MDNTTITIRPGYYTVTMPDCFMTLNIRSRKHYYVVAYQVGIETGFNFMPFAYIRPDGKVTLEKGFSIKGMYYQAFKTLRRCDPTARAIFAREYSRRSHRCYVCGTLLLHRTNVEIGLCPSHNGEI